MGCTEKVLEDQVKPIPVALFSQRQYVGQLGMVEKEWSYLFNKLKIKGAEIEFNKDNSVIIKLKLKCNKKDYVMEEKY